MTRFCWWTLTFFGLCIVEEVVRLHYMGGWVPYATEYPLNVRAIAALAQTVVWLGLWFQIVKKERA